MRLLADLTIHIDGHLVGHFFRHGSSSPFCEEKDLVCTPLDTDGGRNPPKKGYCHKCLVVGTHNPPLIESDMVEPSKERR